MSSTLSIADQEWTGVLVAEVKAPRNPTETQKKNMEDELHGQPLLFDGSQQKFGNFEGLSTMDEIKKMRQELNLLIPLQQQITLIRIRVLQKLAEWKTAPAMRQARNGLAHGGQVISDIPTIANERDPAEKQKLKQGFNRLYNLNFDRHISFTRYNAVVDIANIHANLLTLDEFQSRDSDLRNCKTLLDTFITWEEDGGSLDTYPFTTAMAGAYNRLMRLYGHSLP